MAAAGLPPTHTIRRPRLTSKSWFVRAAAIEDNCVQMISGRYWFCQICLYVPLEAYFDKIWKLDDAAKVD